jgi:hypothetical protein
MDEVWLALWQVVAALGYLLVVFGQFLLVLLSKWTLILVGMAWCLWGINWRKAWPVLAEGAWLPFVLLGVTIAIVWSQVAPGPGHCLGGLLIVPNFWWQLGDVTLLALMALFCGYVQTKCGWAPAELDLEPPAAAAHGHGHH